MRHIPPWQDYDRLAASGEYGSPLNDAAEPAPPPEGADEAGFFRDALVGRHRVLDLGTGPGVPLVTLAGQVGRIVGLDASPAMLAMARRNLAALGLTNASLVRGLAEALPFVDGSFDAIAISGTLCSVPDPAPVIAETARVAAPGALVAVLVWEFSRVLAERGGRVDRSLRRQNDELSLHVVRYLSDPYRVGHERYVLDTRAELVHALLDDPALPPGGRKPTDLAPHEIPPALILDVTYAEEAQFDPETLQAAFARAGFTVVARRVEMSFGTPHVFAVFKKE